MSQTKAAVRGTKIKLSRGDIIFNAIIYTIAVILILVTLYPMYFILIASISDATKVSSGQIMFWPQGVSLKAYRQLAEYAQLWVGYRNTILYAVVGTIITVAVNIPVSYALSRKKLFGRTFFTFFYLIPMFFTGGLIPTYLAVQKFGFLDSFWVMVLPFSVVPYYIIVGRTFFSNSIPEELWEAAQLDGCGYLKGDPRGNRAVGGGRPVEFVFQRTDLSAQRCAAAAAAGASEYPDLESDDQLDVLGRRGRGGEADGGSDQIRCDRGVLGADHVYVSVCTEVLQSGRDGRFRERLTPGDDAGRG